MITLPESSGGAQDQGQLLAAHLAFYRDEIRRKVSGLDEATLRTSILPSGWTPMELLSHLLHMEQRWFLWGFLARPVPDPWGDQGPDGRWRTAESSAVLLARTEAVAQCTTGILREHPVTEKAALGGRFTAEPPTLLAIALHVLQEYARHAGHLDVVRELTDGRVGEDAAAATEAPVRPISAEPL